MRRPLTLIAAGLCALAAAAGAPLGAAAQEPIGPADALSANIQSWANNNMPVAPYLPTMAASGWTGARGDAFWYRVESTQGHYDWTSFDALKSKFDAGGVTWQPILEGSPAWARDPGNGNTLALPNADHVADFARFAAEFAKRYGPGGAMDNGRPVHDIELYNEENAPGAGAHTDAATYARLYQQARAAIKAVQPSIRVIVGAVLYDSAPPTTDADYIKTIFDTLGGSGADAIGLHPYAPTPIGVGANLHRMTDGLAAAGQSGLPVYVNELGYPAALDGAQPKPHAVQGPTTDEARAGTVTLLTDAMLASDCSIRNVAYFDLVNQELGHPDTEPGVEESWKGLERKADGSLTVTGAAYRDAGARWRANPVPGTVHLCGDPNAAPAGTQPLPLALKVDRPSDLCLHPTVTYRGFPIEEATVNIRKLDLQKPSPALTNAAGTLDKDFCVDEKTTYFVQAEVAYAPANVPRFAQSVALTCKLGTSDPCAVIPDSGPGGLNGGQGSGSGGPATGLSAGAKCLLNAFKVTGSKKLATVLRRGLKVKASGCKKTIAGDKTARRVSMTATVDRKAARALKLSRKTPKTALKVAAGTRALTGVRDVTVVVRFTKKARTQLKRAKKVKLSLGVQITEGAFKGTATRTVTLKRS